jgi:hypothetical protein
MLCGFENAGFEAYRRQVESLEVCEIDREHQLELRCDRTKALPNLSNPRRFLSEGVYRDDDGEDVSFLLHARDGWLYLLEIYKGRPVPVLCRRPELARIKLVDPTV